MIAALVAVVPVTDAVAQSRDHSRDRYEQRGDRGDRGDRGRDERGRDDRGRDDRGRDDRGQQRANPAQVAREVQNGRPGRMLGMSEDGGDYTVRWEYPGGRVSDIRVDGRSGRPR